MLRSTHRQNLPTLDALAHDGIVFERAISQVPLTWPSHAVILTGTYPFQNGVQDFTGQPLAPQFRSISQAFQKAGYTTGAVVSAFVLDRSWGLAEALIFMMTRFRRKLLSRKMPDWWIAAPERALSMLLTGYRRLSDGHFFFGCIFTIRIARTILPNRIAPSTVIISTMAKSLMRTTNSES